MKREHLTALENLVERHLLGMRAALNEFEKAIDAQLTAGERVAVNMQTGEVVR